MEYDVFISYCHKDKEEVHQLTDAMREAGLRFFIDEQEIAAFDSLQRRVEEGLAKSRVMLSWYSPDYARSRACQWELAAGYLCRSGERICVVNPGPGSGHIQPRALLDRVFVRTSDSGELTRQIAARVAEFPDTMGDHFGLHQPRAFGFQPAGSNRFVGRVAELWAINDGLTRSANSMQSGVFRSIVQIRGLAGIGKSLLAEEFALRFGAAFPGGIFWLKAFGSDSNKSLEDRESDRKQQVIEFAAQIPLTVAQKPFAEVWAMLAEEMRKSTCLWIVDDVPAGLTREQIAQWFSPHASIPTLITIPDRSHDALGVRVDLDALARDEALTLLRTYNLKDGESEGADSLVEALERHPLAIEIAGAYLEFRNGAVSCADFGEKLRKLSRDELEFAAKVKHSANLTTALRATLGQLSGPAIDLLVLASMLASAPIPAETIDATFARLYQCPPEEAETKRLEATAETDLFALSRLDPVRPEARRVHQLVSRAARQHTASPERVAEIRTAVVSALTACMEQALGSSYSKVLRLGLENTHARELSANPVNGEEAALLVLVGSFDLMRGNLDDAERLARRALDYCIATCGADHDYTNRAKGLLGQVLTVRGDYTGARALFEVVVAAANRNRAPGNIYRMGGQLSLATVLLALGEGAEARRLAESAVAESESANGIDHSLTLVAKTMLAQVAATQGDRERAQGLTDEVLAARRRQAAEGDLDLLFEEFLAIKTPSGAADLRDAELILDKAVDVFAREFGEHHAITLQARLKRLAIWIAKGDIAAAQPEATELIPQLARVAGPAHPLTLQARILQAQTLFPSGRYAEAQVQLEPLIPLLESALSPHHPEVIAARFSLASTLLETGGEQRAYEMLETLVKEADEHLGREHPYCASARCAMISCLCKLGRIHDAQTVWDELIDNRAARVNSWIYPSGNALALAYRAVNDVAAAQAVLVKMIPFAEECLGGEDWTVVTAKMGLALNAAALGQLPEAAGWWEQVLAVNEHRLGKEHPNTTSAAWSLFLARWRMGQGEECFRIFQARFLWFCGKDYRELDEAQRGIYDAIQKNTPWLGARSQ